MSRLERGEREFRALMGIAPEEALAEVRSRSPHMYDAVVETGFGGPLLRAELGRAEREIVTVAVATALGGAEAQLARHADAALNVGVDASELLALCEHLAVYAGFPRALNALAVIDEVVAAAGFPRPAALERIALPDHETVVARRGDTGPAVVLVHALGLDWRVWDAVMIALAEAGRRVFAYDIRGHGAAVGSPIPFTLADTARDLLGVLDALGLEHAHVVGLSFGGGIAQTAAVADPDRFLSLGLLGTTDHPFADAFADRAHAAETEGMEAQVAPTLTRWFTPEALAVNAWPVRYGRERVRRADPNDWAAAWRAFARLDLRGRLDRFGKPTLVLAGERDISTTPEVMRGIAERIEGATYEELPGTPHMQTLEQPGLVADALGRFLPATADASATTASRTA